jgi:hypothetical protein
MDTPSHTPLAYNQYAARVVDSFLDSYARGAIFFGKTWGLTPRNLRKYLIHLFVVRNNKWNIIRDLIKWIQKPDNLSYLSRMSIEDRQYYLTKVKYEVTDRWISGEMPLSGVDAGQDLG